MLKKKAKGVQKDSICEKCGKEVKVLYESDGKKICRNCLNLENKEINTGGFSD
jgi:ribosomal protein S14